MSEPAQALENQETSGTGLPPHFFETMVEDMPVNVMYCDVENFVITYVNKSTRTTLKTIEHVLPIKSEDIVGQCVDVFHKDPSHQRKLLSNPNNLPHEARIHVGDEILDLLVTGVFDNGNYVGAMLTWQVVTQQVKEEEETAKLTQMLDEMPINVMMADPETAVITYINKTSLDTFKTIEDLMPIRADEVMGSCIDVFHKNPAHQRGIIADDSKLPWHTKIKLGDETLDLRVSAIYNKEGKYIGPMVTWSVVTAQVKLADDFETNVMAVVNSVSESAGELQSTSQTMAAAADETSSQAGTVAAASEQLSAAVKEISGQVVRSSEISQSAVDEAQKSNAQVQGLAEAAERIGEVVKLIKDIAEQTNLLALNATIEAARAGDAGKGFAVVASEVKNLATQTAKATGDIAEQVKQIQDETTDAVDAIGRIAKTIEEMSDITTVISSAVEEQSAATEQVTVNITGVTTAATDTGKSAAELLSASGHLSGQSDALSEQVAKFLESVRKM